MRCKESRALKLYRVHTGVSRAERRVRYYCARCTRDFSVPLHLALLAIRVARANQETIDAFLQSGLSPSSSHRSEETRTKFTNVYLNYS